MSVEAVSVMGLSKWLIGLVLAPWLWYERKRVDKLIATLNVDHYTKAETKEQIILRQQPVIEKLEMIHADVVAIRSNCATKAGKC